MGIIDKIIHVSGLTNRTRIVQEEPPIELIEAFEQVLAYPKSRMLVNGLVDISFSALNSQVGRIPFLTTRRAVGYRPEKEVNIAAGIVEEQTGKFKEKEKIEVYGPSEFCIYIFRNKLPKGWELDAIELERSRSPLRFDYRYSFATGEEGTASKRYKVIPRSIITK